MLVAVTGVAGSGKSSLVTEVDTSITDRLRPLHDVGIGHLTLGRPLGTLSGGERQRLKIADRLAERTAVLVLDEPTTGLHPTDVDGPLALLDRLVDAGNTVIAVEHDLDFIRRADWIIDLGPDAGRHGGRIVFQGTPEQLRSTHGSHTAGHLPLPQRDDRTATPRATRPVPRTPKTARQRSTGEMVSL